MPLLVRYGGVTVPTYALLDSGATCSAISSDLVTELGANVNEIPLTLRTFNAKSTAPRKVASFSVANLFDTLEIKIENALVSDFLGTDNERPPDNEITTRYAHLSDVRFTKLQNPAIRLILSARHAWCWLPKIIRANRTDQPVGVYSRLGWYLIGHDRQSDDDQDEKTTNEIDEETPMSESSPNETTLHTASVATPRQTTVATKTPVNPPQLEEEEMDESTEEENEPPNNDERPEWVVDHAPAETPETTTATNDMESDEHIEWVVDNVPAETPETTTATNDMEKAFSR